MPACSILRSYIMRYRETENGVGGEEGRPRLVVLVSRSRSDGEGEFISSRVHISYHLFAAATSPRFLGFSNRRGIYLYIDGCRGVAVI